MQTFKNPFERSLVPEKKYTLPVKALSEKLKTEPGKPNQFLVNCISHMPLASNTTKEEIRINHIHGLIEGRTSDPRFSRPVGQPQLPMAPNTSIPVSMAPSQVSLNPFAKTSGYSQPLGTQSQSLSSHCFSSSHSTIPTLHNQKNINPTGLANSISQSNPFMPKQNQYQGNNSSNQANKNTGMSSFSTIGFSRQTSFGAEINQSFGKHTGLSGNPQIQQSPQQPGQGILGAQSSTGIGFRTINTSSNPLACNLNSQTPGQMASTPSFGTLNQSMQPTNAFNQSTSQPQQNSSSGQTPTNSFLINQTTPLQLNPPLSNLTAPNSQSLPNINQQISATNLDRNIKQLLDSKPNLWNILALDPQYQNGFNQSGRMYVKSVLQRIIDENILSEQSLNTVIVQIYKQMYGADNFQKILQNKKKQIQNDDKISNWKISQLLGKQFSHKMTQSVFPKDIDSIEEDFYRSFKRRSTKFFDEPFLSVKKQDEYEMRLERKFYNIRRPSKPIQLKVKFVQVKKVQEKAKVIDSPYTSQGLEQISEAITQIRNEQRRQIMPKQQELPIIEGFTILPSLQQIKTFTRYELLSVPKVTIANEWGSIRFKAPISLLGKNLAESLLINQRSVEIVDEEWKVRDAEITFKKFANFSQLDEEEQDTLEDKIVAWCEKEKFELLKIDKLKGHVVIEV